MSVQAPEVEIPELIVEMVALSMRYESARKQLLATDPLAAVSLDLDLQELLDMVQRDFRRTP